MDSSDENNTATIVSFGVFETQDQATILNISNELYVDEKTSQSCVWYRFIISVLISGSISTTGIIGNLLAFCTLFPDRKKSATAVLLLALAVVDSLILSIRLMMKTVPIALDFAKTAQNFLTFQRSYMRSYVWTVNSMLDTANTWIVVAVTVQRFVAVCRPLQAPTLASVQLIKKQLLFICMAALVFNIPRAFEYQVVKVSINGTSEFSLRRERTGLARAFSFQYVYKVIIFYLVMYVIPLTILVTLTYKLMKAIRLTTEKRIKMTGSSTTRKQKEDRDVTVSLLAVVIVFVICQLSEPTRRTLAAQLGGNENACGTVYFYYHDIHNLATVVNSSANFIIYCIFGPSFRLKVKALLCANNAVGDVTLPPTSTATSHNV